MNKEKLSCEFRSFVYFRRWIFMSFEGALIAAEHPKRYFIRKNIVRDFIEHVFFAFPHIIAVLAQFCFNLYALRSSAFWKSIQK